MTAVGFEHTQLAPVELESTPLDHSGKLPWHLKPAIAQLVEHLTVEVCSNQMVPGSIPGGRIFEIRLHRLSPCLCDGVLLALGRQEKAYLLGLLAMIKCSICSYQCDN